MGLWYFAFDLRWNGIEQFPACATMQLYDPTVSTHALYHPGIYRLIGQHIK